MGVLACDRRDCTNIMCDYYHHEYGYLCYECVSELQEYLDNGNLNVYKFMATPKYRLEDSNHYTNAYELFTRR